MQLHKHREKQWRLSDSGGERGGLSPPAPTPTAEKMESHIESHWMCRRWQSQNQSQARHWKKNQWCSSLFGFQSELKAFRQITWHISSKLLFFTGYFCRELIYMLNMYFTASDRLKPGVLNCQKYVNKYLASINMNLPLFEEGFEHDFCYLAAGIFSLSDGGDNPARNHSSSSSQRCSMWLHPSQILPHPSWKIHFLWTQWCVERSFSICVTQLEVHFWLKYHYTLFLFRFPSKWWLYLCSSIQGCQRLFSWLVMHKYTDTLLTALLVRSLRLKNSLAYDISFNHVMHSFVKL